MKGLTSQQVLKNRELYGENIMTPPKRDPWYVLLFEKFKDPLIQILSVAAIIALILGIIKGEYMEPIGIISAIVIAVTIGFINEWSASKKFDALSKTSDDNLVKVIRDGVVIEIRRKELVKEDYVLVEAGEEIPADIVLQIAHNAKVNESSLTGESKPVVKEVEENLDQVVRTYPCNFALCGTILEEGSFEGIVVNIGDNTEIGKTARKAAEITDTETPLNKQLNGLASLINKIAFGAAGFLICALLIRYFFIEQSYVGQDWMQITNDLLSFVMIAVALIVVAVPEGLPMAVTLSLAYSMKRMTKANNLIRKMHACETLGATTVICTDKTGTLTENKMKVVYEDILDHNYMFGNIVINSTAYLHDGQTIGNPTEGALLKTIGKTLEISKVRAENPIIYRQEFSSKTKFMLTVIAYGNKYLALIKGAPEIVSKFCKSTNIDPTSQQAKGRRVIGFAYKICDNVDDAQNFTNYNYNGIYAIEDPIRPDVPVAIKAAQKAGIKVKIITGDNPETAVEIARQAGLRNPQSMLGSEIKDKTLNEIKNTDVFARTRPEDKQLLVKKFQQLGEVVAMTGDGTNDAPALNYAEVGIAMNNGTDVAKNAADVILLDNAFPSIILGIKGGRSLYKNIQHFVLFQLTINVVAILIACIGPFIGVNLPFTVTQMLWVNLIMDTFAALALATEPANGIVMFEKPRDPKAFIITNKMWKEIFGVGLVFFAVLITLLLTNFVNLTEFFTIFVMLQWWNLFNARVFGQNRSIFNGITKNPMFFVISMIILIGQIFIVQFGGDMFRTEPMSLQTWLMIIGLTSVVTIVREIYYWVSKIY